MDVYCKCKNYKMALYYAEMYNSVLDTQYKTEDIRRKIDSVKNVYHIARKGLTMNQIRYEIFTEKMSNIWISLMRIWHYLKRNTI